MSDASFHEEERLRGARRRAKSHDARSTRSASLKDLAQPQVAVADKSVRVVCRLRPMSEREKRTGTVPVATASTERREVAVARVVAGGKSKVRSTFAFDDVLTSYSTQEDVFNASLAPLVDEVLAGYEATAFAYGQTGTGKTYTMEGDLETDGGRGLVPRAAAAIIGALSGEDFTEYSVTCQYLEIYNEELSDLLAPADKPAVKLDLKDVPSKGVCCMGLSEVPVTSVDEILSLVHRAQERRRVAETRINARSSRSHCLFTMRVRCRRTVNGGEMENNGKLHLVDLAGSECAKTASGPSDGSGGKASAAMLLRGGETERERKNINQSLLTLGRVITALREGSGRVPYRDSKLTRLLQDALGGRCKTVIIATISPAMSAVEETISTLTYAEQASGIKNRPVASSLLRTAAQTRTGDGSNTNSGSGCGSNDWAELEMKVMYLNQEVEEAQAALARKYREAQDFQAQVNVLTERLDTTEGELQAARQSVEESTFAKTRFEEIANQRGESTAQLNSALDAALAHGESLTQMLDERRDHAAACRQQASGVLDAAKADADSLAAATVAGAKEVAVQLQAARAAHRAAAEVAGEAVQEQRLLLSEALGAARAGGARLRELLSHEAAEASAAQQADGEDARAALALVETSVSWAAAEAGKVQTESHAAASRGTEVFCSRAGAACEELGSERESLLALGESAARDMGEAQRVAQEAHEATERRLEGGARAPQKELEQLLEATSCASEGCVSLVEARRSAEAEAAEATAGRCARLRERLTELEARQASSAAAGPPRLASALAAARSALEAEGPAALAALDSLTAGLREAGGAVLQSSLQGKESISAAMGSARGELDAHWGRQGEGLDAIGARLVAALKMQREGNSSEQVQRAAVDAEAALTTGLKGAMQSLQVFRDNIESQIEELQKQRAAETQAVALLKQQREALQADMGAIRNTLEQERAELAACREEMRVLRSSQERARKSAMEAIAGVVAKEMDSLGLALGESLGSVDGSIAKAEELSSAAAQAAASAEERGLAVGDEVSDVVVDWSKAVGISCGALGAAQERSREVEQSVKSSQVAAAKRLRDLGATSATWGECCEEVSAAMEDADRQRDACREAASQARPLWQASLQATEDSAELWAAECGKQADMALEAAAADARSAGAAVRRLHEEGLLQCGVATEQQVAWDSDCAEHSAALAGITCAAAELDLEERKAGDLRVLSLNEINESAGSVIAQVRQARSSSEEVLKVLEAHLKAQPAERAFAEAAFDAAREALGDLASKAGAALGNAAEAVEGLRSAHGDATRGVCEVAGAVAGKAVEACEEATASSKRHLEGLDAAAGRARECWQRAQDNCSAAIAEVDAAADRAGQAAAEAAQVGSDRILTELENGCKSQTRAATAVEALGGSTSDALSQHIGSLRKGLSAAPLSALEEVKEDPLPAAPRRPDVELAALPTREQLLQQLRSQKTGKAKQPTSGEEWNVQEDQENILDSAVGGKKQVLQDATRAARNILADSNRIA